MKIIAYTTLMKSYNLCLQDLIQYLYENSSLMNNKTNYFWRCLILYIYSPVNQVWIRLITAQIREKFVVATSFHIDSNQGFEFYCNYMFYILIYVSFTCYLFQPQKLTPTVPQTVTPLSVFYPTVSALPTVPGFQETLSQTR